MRTLNLTRTATVKLDGSGNGTAAIGPSLPGTKWLPASVSISMTGGTPTGLATCFIYAGAAPSPQAFVDSTYQVTGAASSLISGQTVWPGQQVFAVFTGGNPHATATMVISGSQQVP